MALPEKLKRDGKFMGGRTMLFYEGVSKDVLGKLALSDWEKRLDPELSPKKLESLAVPDLPQDHPLRSWLDTYWLPHLREPHNKLCAFLTKIADCLSQLEPSVKNIEQWLGEQLETDYKALLHTPATSFRLLLDLCAKMNELDSVRFMATLLSASLLEARYAQTFQRYHP